MDTRRAARVLAALCWTWLGAHVLNQARVAWNDESELRAAAWLLLDRVCVLPRSLPAGRELIPCDEARAVVARGPVALLVLERTAAGVMRDVLAAARHEVGAALRAAGFAGALISGTALFLHTASERARLRAYQAAEDKHASLWRRTNGASYVYMGDAGHGALRLEELHED